MKACSNPKCSQQNPQDLTAFYRDPRTTSGLYSWCKRCVAARSRAYIRSRKEAHAESTRRWKHAHPEKVREWNKVRKRNLDTERQYRIANRDRMREKFLKDRYGLSAQQYAEMLSAQGGACRICQRAERSVDPRNGVIRNLAVDHDHESGKIRGLLCYACNTSLGKIDEDFDTAVRMAKYIQEHKGVI